SVNAPGSSRAIDRFRTIRHMSWMRGGVQVGSKAGKFFIGVALQEDNEFSVLGSERRGRSLGSDLVVEVRQFEPDVDQQAGGLAAMGETPEVKARLCSAT